MRRLFIMIMVATIVMSLVAGCVKKEEETSATADTILPIGSNLLPEDIFDSFEQSLTGSETVDNYTATRLPANQLPETENGYQTLVVTDNLLGCSFHLSIYSTPERYAYRVVLEHRIEDYGYLAFPTFCLYLVKALELTDVDGLELCDSLGLLTIEPEGSVVIDGWELWAFHTDSLMTLVATYTAE